MTLTVASIAALIAATGTFTPAQVQLWAADAALEYRLPTLLWLKQIKQESQFDAMNVNTGTLCYGPAQLNPRFYPPTDTIMVEGEAFTYAHPKGNVHKGASLMRDYLDLGKGEAYALSCFNYGPTATAQNWPRIPKETKDYIRIILGEEFVPKEETVSGFKLSWHYINLGPASVMEQTARAVQAHPGLMVKVMNPPRDNPWPGARVIGRVWIGGDQVEQEYVARGDHVGYYTRCLEAYDATPYVSAWEGPNEPPVATKIQRRRLNEFLCEWAVHMQVAGLYTVGGNLSVGWPNLPVDILDLKDAVNACDYWGIHEYGWIPEPSFYGYHLLRYRTHILEPLRQDGITPKLLITECGLDGGVAGHPGQGWKRAVSKADYWAMMRRYNAELCRDELVSAAFMFTSGPTPDWESFEVDRELSEWMANAYIQEPEPLPQPTHDVQLVQRIRAAACANIGKPVPYNPDTALSKFARENNLGAPLTPEFDVDIMRAQGYALGIVYCPIGQWDKCEVTPW